MKSSAPRLRTIFVGGFLLTTTAMTAPAYAEDGWLDWIASFFGGGADHAVVDERPGLPDIGADLYTPLPKLQMAEASVRVNEGDGEIRLTVRRSLAGGESPVVHYEARPVEAPGQIAARPDVDFRPVSGDLNFGKDALEQTIVVPIVNDGIYERDEVVFEVFLSSPKNARLGSQERTEIIIVDDDPEPVSRTPADLHAAKAAVNFGKAQPGGQAIEAVAIVNSGQSPGQVVSVDVSAPGVQVLEEDCINRPLNAGASCTVMLRWLPEEGINGQMQGRLLVSSSTGGMPITVALSGELEVPVYVDPLAERRLMLREKRRLSTANVVNLQDPVPPTIPDPQYRTEDEDWASQGLGRNYFTFPVDRTKIITPDQRIPCILEMTVNSQIPGYVSCRVDRNVYGLDGRKVLIEAGTAVLGDYEGLGQLGDTRLNVVWRQFIRSDGSRIVISDGFQSLDMAGSTGLPGEVDNKMAERYLQPVLVTLLSAAAAYATPADSPALQGAQSTLSEGLGKVTQQMLDENLDLRPTMRIPKGSRLFIMPLVDLWFPNPERLAPVSAEASKKTPPPKG